MSMELTEEELLLAAKAGNEQALETLVNNYRKLIKKYTQKETYYSWADEQDFWLEGLLAFNKAIKNYDPTKKMSFGNYVKMVITSAIIDFMRSITGPSEDQINKAKAIDDLEEFEAQKKTPDPIAEYIDEENGGEIKATIKNVLNEKQFKILTLYYVSEYSYAEIAEAMEMSTKQVDNALSTIKKKLKIVLKNFL